jgi:dihydroflavonol-4-reductase
MNLVTGATGHIGNVLTRKLLKKGERVRALIWRGEDTSPIEGLDIEKIEGDVLEPDCLKEAFKDVDTVFHLAGIISIMPGENSLVRRVNVEGTRNILEAAKEAGVKRLIYTSSIHAIQRAPHGITIDESLPFDLNNPYGAYDSSKAEASMEVLKAVDEGLDAVIVCPTGVIGPYDFRRSELGEVLRGAASAKPMFYIEGAYDFVDVRDVVEGLLKAREKGRKGESYLLSGHKVTVVDLIEAVRTATGKNFMKIKIPLSLAEFVARFTPRYYLLTKLKPRITPYSVEVLQSNSDISHAKATRELGYQPRPLGETVADTVKWFLKRRNAPGKA